MKFDPINPQPPVTRTLVIYLPLAKFLSKLQMDKKYLENIYTSGQAAINSFKETDSLK